MSGYTFNRETLDAACARAAVPAALRCNVHWITRSSWSAQAVLYAGLFSPDDSALKVPLLIAGAAALLAVILISEAVSWREA